MSARILVVEDEEALTTLLRYNLDAEGYDVETVGRGDDADTRLKERVPDLIVLDWMLPGLSGIELCRRIRAVSNVPVKSNDLKSLANDLGELIRDFGLKLPRVFLKLKDEAVFVQARRSGQLAAERDHRHGAAAPETQETIERVA